MPTFEKLSREDISDILEAKRRGRTKSPRQRVLERYKEQLMSLEVGEGMEVSLEPSDNRQTVKNRLRRAASDLGYQIEFIRSRKVIRIHRVS
mgnify:CR=1 FL=1